ncbi:hypothetical protein [Anaeromyxobacter oryzae]|uniref:PEGA domain-containing protein n=1 Tax=Anaeromyxobacter oryzae TaxID=2918170 RepID=A0ABM7WT89_9BACT|nr:hypothetical protein [Anaeromyxobacter oryzae]BDG02692.1 hypothetical protein AMOR_16880 [Anaeromyxobacter oryzae]
MNVRNALAAAAAALLASGCATIVKGGGPEPVSVRSQPSDADVKIYDAVTGIHIASGKTPVLVPLAKSTGFFLGSKYRVVIEKPGFEKREVLIDSHVSGWYIAGNIAFGLLGWLIIDPATGAMWTLDEQVSVDLMPIAPPPPPSAQAPAEKPVARLMTVDELREQHPELASHLVPVVL